jgi:voltage-dependent potassium channel beta subunit
MNYRKMGRTGLKLSEISLGAWITFGDQIDNQTAREVFLKAYDSGVNFFDNADIYAEGRAESVMGEVIRELPRESLVISSKVFWQTMPGVNGRGLSRKHVLESCHASLKRLGTDYLDLYFCHRFDPETPLEETVRAMDDLVHQGKVLYWGTSEWRAGQIAQVHGLARAGGYLPPTVEQPQYNLFVRRIVEDELMQAANDLGFGLVTWSPLRSGLLSGKYGGSSAEGARLSLRKYAWLKGILTEDNLEKTRRLQKVADEMGVTLPQLAIGWLLRLPQITSVITGATRATQVEENLQAIDVPARLTQTVQDEIEAILGNQPRPEA